MLVSGVAAGEITPAIVFCSRFPQVLLMVAGSGLVSAIGQAFIFVMITNFDSLLVSVVTTARKFISILLSVAWFGHNITPFQWLAIATVFVGIGMEINAERSSSKSKQEPPQSQQSPATGVQTTTCTVSATVEPRFGQIRRTAAGVKDGQPPTHQH
jgi:hypothetical protein